MEQKISLENRDKKVLQREGLEYLNWETNALKLIWVRKLKTSDHKWKNIIKVTYPTVTVLEQLGSSLPIEELRLNTFWNDVFQAYKQFGRKIQVESSDELAAVPIFLNDKFRVGNS